MRLVTQLHLRAKFPRNVSKLNVQNELDKCPCRNFLFKKNIKLLNSLVVVVVVDREKDVCLQ